MAEFRNIFVCSECGQSFPRWAGKCSECGAWNSLVEDAVSREDYKAIEKAEPVALKKTADSKPRGRLATGSSEADLVLGDGILEGSLVLLAGSPGIGKSTLALQIASNIPGTLVLSGEESVEQIASRALRLGLNTKTLRLASEQSFEKILATLRSQKPSLALIDSVQTIYAEGVSGIVGSPTQTKYIAEKLLQFTKETGTAVLLVGHVNKEGGIAGPRTLEHLVDVVLMLEGERSGGLRILRGVKNRFGATDEVGVLEMGTLGLVDVKNPSEKFLLGRHPSAIGSVITALAEGARSFLVEVQALTNTSSFGYPKRTASGMKPNRLDIILAVLERYAGIKLANDDVFLNVVGGLQLEERASDLAVALAVASSKKKKPLPAKLLALGEIGLSGELRPVSFLAKRVKEAEKLGFTQIILPTSSEPVKTKMQVMKYSTVNEVVKAML